MNDVSLQLNEQKKGAFIIKDGDQQLGEMVVSISGKNLTVYHTEVVPEAEGKGLAKKMLQEMVDYARKNGLKVIPLCPYVHAQFRRHPDEYADLWQPAGE
jgi:predicted GNAT family acetyltransferase